MVLKRLFARAPAPPARHSLPPGERVYAIGDIHGRLDCFEALLAGIDADDAARGRAKTTLVLLGDLIDRGPNSKAVVERAMRLAETRECVMLMGNHEEILIAMWERDPRAAVLFHRVGGRETLLSYGVAPEHYDCSDAPGLVELAAEYVPAEHIAFLHRFGDSWRAGDYLFVHAGIAPGIAFEAQDPSDLRWIRREFLDDPRDHGAMVVHGHSISERVEELPNRIGIDTGAYATGRLTALALEGGERWFLEGFA